MLDRLPSPCPHAPAAVAGEHILSIIKRVENSERI